MVGARRAEEGSRILCDTAHPPRLEYARQGGQIRARSRWRPPSPGVLRQPLLQLLAVVVRGGVLDLLTDLLDAARDRLALLGVLVVHHDRGVVLVHGHLLRGAEVGRRADVATKARSAMAPDGKEVERKDRRRSRSYAEDLSRRLTPPAGCQRASQPEQRPPAAQPT